MIEELIELFEKDVLRMEEISRRLGKRGHMGAVHETQIAYHEGVLNGTRSALDIIRSYKNKETNEKKS